MALPVNGSTHLIPPYYSTDLLTVRGVAHLVVHGTSGSTSYETIPHVQLEISGDVLSTCRPRTWWCNDATALVGYVKLMMMTHFIDPEKMKG